MRSRRAGSAARPSRAFPRRARRRPPGGSGLESARDGAARRTPPPQRPAPASAAGTRSSVGAPPAGSPAASHRDSRRATARSRRPRRGGWRTSCGARERSLPDEDPGRRRLVYAEPCYIVSWSIALGNIPTAMAEANVQPHNGSATRRRRRSTGSPEDAPPDETFRPPQGDGRARAAEPEAAQPEASQAPELTIEQLAQDTGMTVRNIRAHQSRGLLPPPVIRGRTGYYGREHVARLELIAEMQADGFNLKAIERLV